jgi:hypothetical protein
MLRLGMANETGSQSAEDWRLEAELEAEPGSRRLGDLVGRFRGPDPVREIKDSVPHDVVVTHDGRLLFAYAATEEKLAAARGAIEAVLEADGVGASLRVSTWDHELDRWRQVDPPPSVEQAQAEERATREGNAPETRTIVASSGRPIRKEFELTMCEAAERLGLECKVVEHPHLLTTQVAFTVTGPTHKIEEFASDLKAEGVATLRTDWAVLLSPI